MKYPGGKEYMKKEILAQIPGHTMYVEPFFGSGKIFFAKNAAKFNILSDIDPHVINFWAIVRVAPESLMKGLLKVPYKKEAFEVWRDDAVTDMKTTQNKIISAMRFFILHQMSRSGMCADFSDSKRLRRDMLEGDSAYVTNVNELIQLGQQLGRASLLNKNVFEILEIVEESHNHAGTFLYLDPPYHGVTGIYPFDMSEDDHGGMLTRLTTLKCNIMISNYDNPLYRDMLNSWHLTVIDKKNRMGQGDKLTDVKECLWRNYF